ncbi:transcription elongation factor SPT6 homolog isoform X2 [Gossypium hirsutum]|uniref:Transcription elongation factor SPT6 homolog isoform X2 n=1 Tax=Gossypium hirsutum TaxID=3635 RepID=A0A1U8NTG4_GOSHI|nr:transcription elongation factor SPT6 homolog isoform X2 [Gossypium hirsutum]
MDDEEEEEDKNDQVLKSKKMKKKKRKRRSVKDPVLYDDDGELVQENKISGICQFPKETEMVKRLKRAGKRTKVVEKSGSSDDEGLLFDDIFGEEKASFCGQNYEMSDFIVSEEKSYGEASSLRWLKMNKKKMEQVVTICLSALDDKVPITDDANQTLNHRKQVQASKVNLDNSSEFEPFFLANKYTTERDGLIRQTNTPERMQVYFVAFNPLRTGERSVEVSVLLNKIKKEDIMRFLELHHVKKFDVPFIAMYRKEQCLSLLDDFEKNEAENEDNDDVEQAGQLKWHKVLWIIKELDMWLLL